MAVPPNELFSALSFIGFVMCTIPFYWHLEGMRRYFLRWAHILMTYCTAWSTGTCLYMFWAGLGCLLECINSIVWNKNMILRAPIYCDFGELLHTLFLGSPFILFHPTVARIQVAQNVAIPAASLCINRRLYKIATIKAVTITPSEKRRGIVVDLLICIGLPILQMISRESAWSGFLSRLFTRV